MNHYSKTSESPECECAGWDEYVVEILGGVTFPDVDDFFQRFDVLKERNPGLVLVKCKSCNQGWYVAIDDSIDDAFHLVRVTHSQIEKAISRDEWPDPAQTADASLSWLGDEVGLELCKKQECKRKRVMYSVMCRLHHYEMLNGYLWKI